jgi:hypothetical protein
MNEIIPNLYLGSMLDAKHNHNDMLVLSVMWEGEPGQEHSHVKIPTTTYQMWSMDVAPKDGMQPAEGVQVDPVGMDRAADMIHAALTSNVRLLVHCAFGIERSPLTVVWYLMRHMFMNLREAYDLVLARRPEAQYRGAWLPTSVKLDGVLPCRST